MPNMSLCTQAKHYPCHFYWVIDTTWYMALPSSYTKYCYLLWLCGFRPPCNLQMRAQNFFMRSIFTPVTLTQGHTLSLSTTVLLVFIQLTTYEAKSFTQVLDCPYGSRQWCFGLDLVQMIFFSTEIDHWLWDPSYESHENAVGFYWYSDHLKTPAPQQVNLLCRRITNVSESKVGVWEMIVSSSGLHMPTINFYSCIHHAYDHFSMGLPLSGTMIYSLYWLHMPLGSLAASNCTLYMLKNLSSVLCSTLYIHQIDIMH